MSKVYGFDESGFRRVRETVRRVLGGPRTGAQRRRQTPVVGGGCKGRNEFWQLTVVGSPTGGTFDMDLTVGGTTDTLTFDYDFTASEVKTELATHTNLSSADLDVTGGDFPDRTVNVEFLEDFAKSFIPAPVFDWSSLTGGSGVAVILGRYQPGYPIDAS